MISVGNNNFIACLTGGYLSVLSTDLQSAMRAPAGSATVLSRSNLNVLTLRD